MLTMSKVLLAGTVSAFCLGVLVMPLVAHASPDPCLMVYPETSCMYHYDPAEYYTVEPGHPLYDPVYDRGGEVLITLDGDDIGYEVYQAPNLTGFVVDSENQGYFTLGNELDVIVDGFSNAPTTYINILVVFDRIEPAWCQPTISVDGNPVLYAGGLGWYYPIGDLVVSTPTPWGNNYSDTRTVHMTWENCYGIRIYAFSDANYNLVRDGGECRVAFSHDTTVPTEESTWGGIKALYSD